MERRAAAPLIDLGLLARRPLPVAHLGALTLGGNQFICYVLVPRLAELSPVGDSGGFGLSVTGAALVLLPGTLLTLPASWLAAPLERRLGTRVPLVAGGGGFGAAFWLASGVAALGVGLALCADPSR